MQRARGASAAGRVGAYHRLTLAAPGSPSGPRPGQFVAVSRRRAEPPRCCCAGRSRSTGTGRRRLGHRRSCRRARAGHRRGWPGVRPGEPLDVVGPLGRPFPLPAAPAACLLVGGGYGSAPLFGLAEALRAARSAGSTSCSAAATGGPALSASWRPSGPPARSPSPPTTAPPGARGSVADALPRRAGADRALAVVYACGPMAMLRAVGARRRRRTGCPSRSPSRSRWPAGSGSA